MDYGVFHMSDDFALRTYANMVYQIALRYTQNTADAEDVFSDTFLAYYTRKPEFECEEHRKGSRHTPTSGCKQALAAAPAESRGSAEE